MLLHLASRLCRSLLGFPAAASPCSWFRQVGTPLFLLPLQLRPHLAPLFLLILCEALGFSAAPPPPPPIFPSAQVSLD